MRTLLLLPLLLLTGCPYLDGEGGGSLIPDPPEAKISALNLLEHPSEKQLAAYYCSDLGDDFLCSLAFSKIPKRSDLKFSFETVFDLGNPNSFPIPTIEMLLALDVFEGADQAELAALCISFCDPQVEDCDIQQEEACQMEGQDIKEYKPSIDDLIELAVDVAQDVATGELDENLKFRMIPGRELLSCQPDPDCEVRGDQFCCAGSCKTLKPGCEVEENEQGQTCASCPGHLEAHVRFDLGLDAILGILETLVLDSLDELVQGKYPSFSIPYKAEGTLFFDVPKLGRFSLNFGPLSGTWDLD